MLVSKDQLFLGFESMNCFFQMVTFCNEIVTKLRRKKIGRAANSPYFALTVFSIEVSCRLLL